MALVFTEEIVDERKDFPLESATAFEGCYLDEEWVECHCNGSNVLDVPQNLPKNLTML